MSCCLRVTSGHEITRITSKDSRICRYTRFWKPGITSRPRQHVCLGWRVGTRLLRLLPKKGKIWRYFRFWKLGMTSRPREHVVDFVCVWERECILCVSVCVYACACVCVCVCRVCQCVCVVLCVPVCVSVRVSVCLCVWLTANWIGMTGRHCHELETTSWHKLTMTACP